MKNSMKFFWAVAAVIVIILVAFVIAFRVVVSDHIIIDRNGSTGNVILEKETSDIVEKNSIYPVLMK
jgi:hypothetical protein